MKRSTLSMGVYVLLVFLSGAVIGGFAHRLYMMNSVFAGPAVPKPDEVRRQYMDEMRKRLSLTGDQVTTISGILDSTKTRYHEVKQRWDKYAKDAAKPELKAIQEDQIEKVKQILSEPQRVEYEKLREERRLRQIKNAPKPNGPQGD